MHGLFAIISITIFLCDQTALAINLEKAILGKWININSLYATTTEIFEDGTIVVRGYKDDIPKPIPIICDYRFLDEAQMRIDCKSVAELKKPESSQVSQVSINDGILVIEGFAGKSIRVTKATEIYLEGFSQYHEKSFSEAVKLFETAGEMGDPTAQSFLAHIYYYGEGVERNEQKAFKWALKAANQGVFRSQGYLGMMYYAGVGTEKNTEKAIFWLKKAHDNGDGVAKINLDWINRDIENQKTDEANPKEKGAQKRSNVEQSDEREFDLSQMMDQHSRLSLDVIRKSWEPPEIKNEQQTTAPALIDISIKKDGKISNVWFKQQSNIQAINDSAWKAIKQSDPLPALPREHPKSTRRMTISFSDKGVLDVSQDITQ